MDYGVKKLCEGLSARLEASIESEFNSGWTASRIDSPIERLFFITLKIRRRMFPIFVDYFCSPEIEMQKVITDYPVDFLLWLPESAKKKVVVECDGHDFHERTKEQAARDRSRDRALQAVGYTVFRFTGSEICRDPIKCAEEVLNILEEEYWAHRLSEAPSPQTAGGS